MIERLHLSPRHCEEIEALLHKHLPDVEVWAYGSRVNGRSHDGSDLDLVLRGPKLAEIDTSRIVDFISSPGSSISTPSEPRWLAATPACPNTSPTCFPTGSWIPNWVRYARGGRFRRSVRRLMLWEARPLARRNPPTGTKASSTGPHRRIFREAIVASVAGNGPEDHRHGHGA